MNEQLKRDLEAVLALPQGSRYLWTVIERSGAFSNVWAPGEQIHRNAGRQDVGLMIWRDVEAVDPALLMQMLAEHYSRQTEGKTEDD